MIGLGLGWTRQWSAAAGLADGQCLGYVTNSCLLGMRGLGSGGPPAPACKALLTSDQEIAELRLSVDRCIQHGDVLGPELQAQTLLHRYS